jgi:hypothetical protein
MSFLMTQLLGPLRCLFPTEEDFLTELPTQGYHFVKHELGDASKRLHLQECGGRKEPPDEPVVSFREQNDQPIAVDFILRPVGRAHGPMVIRVLPARLRKAS